MQLKDLFPFVVTLLLVAMVISMGVLTLDRFGHATLERVTVEEETQTTSNTGLATLDETPLFSVTNAEHSNGTVYPVSIVNADLGTVQVTGLAEEVDLDYDYVYGAATATSASIASTTNAVGDIATDWMGLIVLIGVMALILGLTIAGFSKFGGR